MSTFVHLQTVSDIFNFFRLKDHVRHPLIAVVDFSKVTAYIEETVLVTSDFYTIIFKQYCNNNMKYGRKPVDFQDGNLICMAPSQAIELEYEEEISQNKGLGIFFHPDLIRATSLSDKMKDYGFFSYDVSEALHLSEKEKQVLDECITKIDTELQENIDVHSQAIIVSTIELMLNYCTRFYGRQFITRKTTNNSVVAQVEKILNGYFSTANTNNQGLPTVKFLADKVNLSPNYLSDLLKKETGKNTQDHIHFHVIEEAKNILLSTNKSAGEIAYQLGFEYPQYFTKLFKQKTGKTPIEFRSMN